MTITARHPTTLALLLLVSGCGGGGGGGDTDDVPATGEAPTPEAADITRECVLGSGTATAPATFDATSWTGEYALVMLGPDGARTQGSLILLEQAPDLQSVVGPGGEVAGGTRIPLYGWTDIDATAVGATVPGSATSEDPEAPGVILLASSLGNQSPTLMFRLGSEANRRGETRYDGAFTVLRVTETAEDGFRGRWTSGVAMDRAEGTFCAFRH